jgi:hypothetical protein
MLATAQVRVKDNEGRHVCPVLLDSRYQSYFITESLATRPGVQLTKNQVPIMGIINSTSKTSTSVDLEVASLKGD